MADTKLRLPLGITGWTVYTRLKNESGQIYQTTGTPAFVTYVVANVANYKLLTPETPAASGDYEATMPAGAAAGNYTWAHYKLIGSDPAISDPLVGSGSGYWDGTTFGGVAGIGGGTARTVDQDFHGDEAWTIVNADGTPILGIVVTAYLAAAYATSGTSATSQGSTTTDASGHWTLSLTPATYTIAFSTPSTPFVAINVIEAIVT
jgi:hypothetical protein